MKINVLLQSLLVIEIEFDSGYCSSIIQVILDIGHDPADDGLRAFAASLGER